MRTLLIVPTANGIGLTSTCMGLLRALDFAGLSTAFYKPFLQEELPEGQIDGSIELVQKTLHLSSPAAIERAQIERMIGANKLDTLLEDVVASQQNIGSADVLVVEGLVPTADTSYADDINWQLACALDANVILVTSACNHSAQKLAATIDMHASPFGGLSGERVLACVLTRMQNLEHHSSQTAYMAAPGETYGAWFDDFCAQIRQHSPAFATEQCHVLGVIPFLQTVNLPRTSDIARMLGAKWLNRGQADSRRVRNSILTARSVAHSLHSVTAGTLVVTPGDRDDILVAAALAAMNGVPLAGILLTGGYKPSKSTLKLCANAFASGLPVFSVKTDSFTTVQELSKLSPEIPADDSERAEKVTSYVAAHLDLKWLKTLFKKARRPRLSPSAYRYKLVKKAQKAAKRIVLPEGAEPRTVEAACICQARGIANCVLLAQPDEVKKVAQARNLTLPDGLQILDPEPIKARYVEPMVERRKGKLTAALAESQLQDNVVLATMMLYLGEVDGLVSGAIHTTANTVRPAFQLIKTAPEYSLVSSVFFMLLPTQVVVYGDCAINPDPNAQELAEIAIQSAKSAAAFGIEPKVAMISYSTGASGSGDDVDKVRQATEIARKLAPDLIIDGPLQYDAAAIESVGKQKAPDSKVAGQATVFVFPDLNTGNTTYKAVQRSANVVSVGPMLQGLNKPVNDLSRGALVDDIVFTIALTAIQAASDNI